MIKLSASKVSITLVETMHNYEALQDIVLRKLAFLYGGSTRVAQDGAWIDSKGNMVVEKGVCISAYVSDHNAAGADEAVTSLATLIFHLAENQDAVLFTLSDGTAMLTMGDN